MLSLRSQCHDRSNKEGVHNILFWQARGKITIIPSHLPEKVPMVLNDYGGALNVCPFRIASCLGIGIKDFLSSSQNFQAYDNTWREVLGNVVLDLTIGPAI